MALVRIFPDPPALYAAAAERVTLLAAAAIRERDAFHLALAGGNTPRGLYERLSSPPFREPLRWEKVQVYFGDERCVPPDDPESNYRMAREALLEQVAIPHDHIHGMACEESPGTAARRYQALLQEELPQLRFDLILLGVGTDGHIASLFPGNPATEATDPVTAVELPSKQWRLTLTLPVLNRARHLMVLVTGEAKAAVVARALGKGTAFQEPLLPVQRLVPDGRCEWFVDKAAAKDLEPRE